MYKHREHPLRVCSEMAHSTNKLEHLNKYKSIHIQVLNPHLWESFMIHFLGKPSKFPCLMSSSWSKHINCDHWINPNQSMSRRCWSPNLTTTLAALMATDTPKSYSNSLDTHTCIFMIRFEYIMRLLGISSICSTYISQIKNFIMIWLFSHAGNVLLGNGYFTNLASLRSFLPCSTLY